MLPQKEAGHIPSKLAPRIAKIIRQHLPDERYQLFCFGSRATGRARPGSDIDIGIDGPVPVPLRTLALIDEDLESLPTLYTIEVVDLHRASREFRDTALKQIVALS